MGLCFPRSGLPTQSWTVAHLGLLGEAFYVCGGGGNYFLHSVGFLKKLLW